MLEQLALERLRRRLTWRSLEELGHEEVDLAVVGRDRLVHVLVDLTEDPTQSQVQNLILSLRILVQSCAMLLRLCTAAWSRLPPRPSGLVREFSKFVSKSAAKRIPLNAKHARKGYKKGKGCRTEGRLTSKGRFIVNPERRLELVVPDLTGFKLTVRDRPKQKFPLPRDMILFGDDAAASAAARHR